jgi:hypothetical protein
VAETRRRHRRSQGGGDLSIARRWYEVEGVDMITELTTSSVALAIQELSKERRSTSWSARRPRA